MLRGSDNENAAELRGEAIELLNRQEGSKEGLKEGRRSVQGIVPLISSTEWTPLGPHADPERPDERQIRSRSGAPYPCIHPTNPDIVYVGTAQGGLYGRSTAA